MPVSLHTHSWYSLLEGAASPAELVARAVEGGHMALALTDTNNLYGVVPFVEAAAAAGLRPIVGACLRHGGRQAVALVAERAGYHSLCQVISGVQLSGGEASVGRGPPVIPPEQGAHAPRSPDLAELLLSHHDGLHVLTDDAGLAEQLRDGFRRRLWLEVVRPGCPRREEKLRACAGRLGARLVASTAAHLARAEEYPALRLAAAVRENTLLDRLPPVLSVTPEHRLLPVAEMRRRFGDLPEAIRGGDDLAGLMRADVLPREPILPTPKLTRQLDLAAYLKAHCERGLRDRGLGADLTARRRLGDELAVIEAKGLVGYFLTVRDIAREARRRGHTMALRGSAGNSLVCYLLGITDVDPLRFGLEMERFLHMGRVDLPDIDLDFDWKVRDEIIDHVVQRYGSDHVARISSHLFLQPRSAFRESGKLHGLSGEQVSELLTHLDTRVDEMLLPDPSRPRRPPPPPRAFPLEPRRWPRIVADARRLLGRPTHLSLHPGGIVLTPRPVRHHAPLQWAAKGVVMTQYEKDAAEYVGLVKIDLLGNRALATVDEAARLARAPLPPATACDGDEATRRLLRGGDALGVTQLESPAMRHLLIQMGVRGLDDVIQTLALVRPGAASIGMKDRFLRRRRGLEARPAGPPEVERLLGETEGMMLYEDDALRLVQALTGLPTADADRFCKRVRKHRTEEEAEELRAEFLRLCDRHLLLPSPPVRGRGAGGEGECVPSPSPLTPLPRFGGEGDRTSGLLAELWLQLSKLNRYSFCKSHAVSYGLIAWQAAYLKAHHPAAFWAAALNNNMGAYPRRVYVEAVKRAGLELRLPCVNRSRLAFHVEDGAIRVGLEAITGVPEEVKLAIVERRGRDGPYRDLGDLRRRVAVGPEALGMLIRAGALDFTGRSRPALFLEAKLRAGHSRADRGLVAARRPARTAPPRRVAGARLHAGPAAAVAVPRPAGPPRPAARRQPRTAGPRRPAGPRPRPGRHVAQHPLRR